MGDKRLVGSTGNCGRQCRTMREKIVGETSNCGREWRIVGEKRNCGREWRIVGKNGIVVEKELWERQEL